MTNAAKLISRSGTIKFYCIVLYCIVLYCIVLYCIVLYCIVLYCIVLYCIVLSHDSSIITFSQLPWMQHTIGYHCYDIFVA